MSINVNRVCMKKMILLAVIASVTLASCVKTKLLRTKKTEVMRFLIKQW